MTIGGIMQEISISEFKAKCLSLLEQVRATKKPIRITRFGKPVAEVVPPTAVVDREDWIGSMEGTFEILGDIISPAIDEDEWEVLRD
jgi:prevent-host-death family protein